MADETTAIAMCDQQPCDEPATLTYRWAWGDTGQCCAKHAILLQQTATNVKRAISITPLASAAPAPLTRDERTQLIAARLSAEAECEEIKSRGAELYRQNVDLTKQVQTLTVQKREADALLRESDKETKALESKLRETQAELGDAVNEVKRLEVLASFAPDTEDRTQHA